MPDTFRFYTLLRPLRSRYVDDGSSVLASIPVLSDGRQIDVALTGPADAPEMIRVSVSGLESQPDFHDRQLFDELADCMLAILRTYMDSGISFTEPRFRYGNFIEDGLPPNLDIEVNYSQPGAKIDLDVTFTLMQSDREFRGILFLYSDAVHAYLPIQYRYLSAFKILEQDFKSGRRRWRPELDTLLSHFDAEYDALGIRKLTMKGLMIDLRDKCAHIEMGASHDLTAVGSGSREAVTLVKSLPLILTVIAQHVLDTYKSDGAAFRSIYR